MSVSLADWYPWVVSDAETLGDEDYCVFPAHPAFSYLWHVTLSISAMGFALAPFHGAQVNQGDHIKLSCIGFDYTLRIPAFGPVDNAIHNRSTAYVPITIHHGRSLPSLDIFAPAVRRWIEQILWPGLIDLYEKNKKFVHRNNPQLADFAKVLRDSCAHGGEVTMRRSTPPVSWGGLTISPSQNGLPLGNLFGFSDFLVVALKLFDGPV